MTEVEVIPELKQIIGALLFAAKNPLTLKELVRVIQETGGAYGGYAKEFEQVAEADVEAALTQFRQDLESHKLGFHVADVAGGFRLQNDRSCGPWLRFMLEKGRGNRLSKPALETLAIIAYRQPCMRSEIEAVRGVAVDQILRNLLDLQLIRIVGRSELPGRPWLFGTTQKFLEYFGIKDVKDLPGTEELRRMEAEQLKKKEQEPSVISNSEQPSKDQETMINEEVESSEEIRASNEEVGREDDDEQEEDGFEEDEADEDDEDEDEDDEEEEEDDEDEEDEE